ncbi:MAG: ATP-binding protein [Campylobacterota bacterium]|nr:ATP-binding protein [Campylobacterota bacterium]
MKFSINIKLLFLVLVTILIALTINSILYYNNLKSEYLKNFYSQSAKDLKEVQSRITHTSDKLQKTAKKIITNHEIKSIVNLISNYQDKNNYDIDLFDMEKKKLYHLLKKAINTTEDYNFAILDKDMIPIVINKKSFLEQVKGIYTYRNNKLLFLDIETEKVKDIKIAYPLLNKEFKDKITKGTQKEGFYIRLIKPIHNNGNLVGYFVLKKLYNNDNICDELLDSLSYDFSLLSEDFKLGSIKNLDSALIIEHNNKPSNKISDFGTLIENSDYFYYSDYFSDTDNKQIYLVSGLNKNDFNSKVNELIGSLVTSLFLATIITFTLILIFLKKVLFNRIDNLIGYIDQIKNNKYIPIKTNKSDEIDIIIEELNTLTIELDKSFKEIENINDLLQRILDTVPVRIFWKDKDGKYLGANKLFIEDTGLNSIDDLLGKTDYEMPWSKDDADNYRKDDLEVLTSRKPKLFIEETQTTKNNEIIYLLTSKVPLLDIGVLGTYQDISEQKLLSLELEELNKNLENKVEERTIELIKAKDEAENATKSKSEFLANMSHEIRTPLNAIVGFVDILKDENIDDKSLEYVNIIDKSSHSLLRIIEDILDFSKIESGKLNIEKIYFDPYDQFKIITDLFGAKCSNQDITLNVNIDDTLPLSIKSDPLRIKQVISNLLSNAIKFTESKKGIFVNISYSDGYLIVSIKDDGKGIPNDKLTHIFEAFSQEDNSTTRKYGGTGLGLAISSSLIKLLGGELKVRSELGIGSEFYFSIPAEYGEKLSKTDTLVNKNYKFNNQKLLVVEDNKSNQIFMKVVLNKLNLKFDFANDGIEAIEMYKKNKYSLILMDENMPNMNGIEATRQILNYEEENKLIHIPIVALTANALKGDRERFLDAGMDEYLTKPLDKNKLILILNQFI